MLRLPTCNWVFRFSHGSQRPRSFLIAHHSSTLDFRRQWVSTTWHGAGIRNLAGRHVRRLLLDYRHYRIFLYEASALFTK